MRKNIRIDNELLKEALSKKPLRKYRRKIAKEARAIIKCSILRLHNEVKVMQQRELALRHLWCKI